jgi:hypothetical protein
MATLLLDDLATRISQQEAQLQALRRELESRQRQLAGLSDQKQRLLAQLQQIDAQIGGIAGRSAPVKVSRATADSVTPNRQVVIRRPAGNGSTVKPEPGKAATKRPARKQKARYAAQAGQPTLPVLLVTMLREAGRPLTVKELAAGAKRRGFQSSSHRFSKMVQVTVQKMKRKGLLQRAAGQPGFVLAKQGSGKPPSEQTTPGQLTSPKTAPQSTKPTSAAKSASTSSQRPQAPAGAQPRNRVPLKQVLNQVLQKCNKPMSGGELAKLVLKTGYRTTSKNFTDVVWAMLPSMDHVEHIPNQGYRLKQQHKA